ncbi:universal stress protein [Methylonatrum kenyense]|uniref:universal stress protein n=1 Tax=Methylonatrum kenyense TaxID=455253 RepID=UPI0020BD6B7E|nr:universal stress protein [Methylonatrum kenyense]MCK8515238.1 universal stress protein [Methylonatrum kenyense]
MFEHVVVAAHFGSANPINLRSIEQLKQRGMREITLVDVLRSHDASAGDEEHRKSATRRLEDAREHLEDGNTKVNVELRIGQPAHELSTLARAREASLIMVASRGESAFREFLRGSTVLQLARKTTVPVLIEPATADGLAGVDLGRPLLATDFSDSGAGAEAMALELLAAGGNGTLVHVIDYDAIEDQGESEAERYGKERLDALAARVAGGQKPECRLGRGNPSKQIIALADETDAGVIIIGKRGHSPVRELMLGGTAAALVRRTTRPLLLVPSPRRGI